MAHPLIIPNLRQLAQYRSPNTDAISVLTTNQKRRCVITSINIANTTNAAATYSLYLDKNGTTYDQTTALAYGVQIAANSQVLEEFVDGLPLGDPTAAGNLAVQSNTTNALTFTINGVEIL